MTVAFYKHAYMNMNIIVVTLWCSYVTEIANELSPKIPLTKLLIY